jgi:hypothetical protein
VDLAGTGDPRFGLAFSEVVSGDKDWEGDLLPAFSAGVEVLGSDDRLDVPSVFVLAELEVADDPPPPNILFSRPPCVERLRLLLPASLMSSSSVLSSRCRAVVRVADRQKMVIDRVPSRGK